jgi:hypothetical protein
MFAARFAKAADAFRLGLAGSTPEPPALKPNLPNGGTQNRCTARVDAKDENTPV